MKLTKLFFCAILAVCAMAFVACESDTPSTPKEYALELTSDAVMEFPAEGGEGNISWEYIYIYKCIIRNVHISKTYSGGNDVLHRTSRYRHFSVHLGADIDYLLHSLHV